LNLFKPFISFENFFFKKKNVTEIFLGAKISHPWKERSLIKTLKSGLNSRVDLKYFTNFHSKEFTNASILTNTGHDNASL
jgi:hypothetical protein